MKSVQINITECDGIPRINEPFSIGLPFSNGALSPTQSLCLKEENGNQLALSSIPLSFWPDGSVRWLLIASATSLDAHSKSKLFLAAQFPATESKPRVTKLEIADDSDFLTINTGSCSFQLSKTTLSPYPRVVSANNSVICELSVLELKDEQGQPIHPEVTSVAIDSDLAPQQATISVFSEIFINKNRAPAKITSRTTFYTNSSQVKCEITLHNPNAAKHPGGLWDLGDEGSILFKELSLSATVIGANEAQLTPDINKKEVDVLSFTDCSLKQHSSGGEHWKSNVHKNSDGKVTLSQKGYTIISKVGETATGDRASPQLRLTNDNGFLSIVIPEFWENFPNELKYANNKLCFSPFPENENGELFELQAGEKKTTTLYFDYSDGNVTSHWFLKPFDVVVDREHFARANALPAFSPKHVPTSYDEILNQGISGKNNFFSKREIIDEFGWRNFGDLYADHETIKHKGEQPLVSHYNNQYDPLYGFLRQHLETGDPRWKQLANSLACHIVDIDIYDTEQDRAEYNGGLFWHTDHYLDASTCTHRTFSRDHAENSYMDHTSGGGPGEEHCYSTGLMYFYFLTGDKRYKHAVEQLSAWVSSLEEGQGLLLERLLRFKSKDLINLKKVLKGQKVPAFKYPLTRGTGNYINTLLDHYLISSEPLLLSRVSEIIKLTVHPGEDLTTRNLENVEVSWSYTVFLQALIRFMSIKLSNKETDEHFEYARAVLRLFANWMQENEAPYLEKPDILEFPNETWIAQDIRKANILFAASHFLPKDSKKHLEKAEEILKYVLTELSTNDASSLTRIQAILMQNYGPHTYYKNTDVPSGFENREILELGQPPYQDSISILKGFTVDMLLRLFKISITKELAWLRFRTN